MRIAKSNFILSTMLLVGCGDSFKPENFTDPVELLGVSESMYRDGNCGDASLGLRQVSFSVPARDSIALRSRFLLAECHLQTNEFLEAARQFQRIADEAPQSPLCPQRAPPGRRFVRQVVERPTARSYLWRDGALHLS